MLYTNLIHLETAPDLRSMIDENENIVVVCGTMGPECVPVYRIAETLGEEFTDIRFCDMEYNNPESATLRTIFETELFTGLPFVVYFHLGKIVKITSGAQSHAQITCHINELLVKTETV